MTPLFGFAPFILFAIVDRVAGPVAGIASGALVALALLARDLVRKEPPKLLDVGSVLIFVALAVYALAVRPSWSVWSVRLFVDAGLLALVLGSLAVRRPFTLAYARQRVDKGLGQSPRFVHTNMVVTAAWAAALAVIVLADLLMLHTDQDRHEGIVLVVLALVAAMQFTSWYPRSRRVRSQPG